MKFNPDGLQTAMQELLSFDSAKRLDEIEPQRYSQLKKECEAVIQAYCAGMEMGDYFDEILGIPKMPAVSIEAASKAMDAAAKEDFRGGIRYDSESFAKACADAWGLKTK